MPVVEGIYTSSTKAKICKSAFISKQFNLRGLESALHSLFQEISHDLTQSYDNIIPHIHDTFWLSWDYEKNDFKQQLGRKHPPKTEGDEDAMSIDNDDFGEDVNDQVNDFGEEEPTNDFGGGEQANEIGEEVIMNEQANEIGGEVDEKLNVSSESARTVPGKELECIPDLVFHHARTSALIEDTLYSRRRAGIKLHHFCPVVISEFKAGPHRGLSEELLKLEISLHFAEAYKQLARYLVWTFAKHPYLDEIVAIPVAGLYWYYVRVLRSDMPEYDWKKGKFCSNKEVAEVFGSNKIFEVCTPNSDAAFTQLLNDYLHPLGVDNM